MAESKRKARRKNKNLADVRKNIFCQKRPDFGSPIPGLLRPKDERKKNCAPKKKSNKSEDYITIMEFTESDEYECIEIARDAANENVIEIRNNFQDFSQGFSLTPRAPTSYKRKLKTGINAGAFRDTQKEISNEGNVPEHFTSTPVSRGQLAQQSLDVSEVLNFEGDSEIPLVPHFEKEVNSDELIEGLTPEDAIPCNSTINKDMESNHSHQSNEKNEKAIMKTKCQHVRARKSTTKKAIKKKKVIEKKKMADKDKFELSYSQREKQVRRKKTKSKFSPLVNDKETDETEKIDDCCLKYLSQIKIQSFVVGSRPATAQLFSPLNHIILDGRH